MEALRNSLRARTKAQFDDQWPAAKGELEGIFPATTWGIRESAVAYTEASVTNLWQNELSKPVRDALLAASHGESDFADWLGEIHYVGIALYLKSLFDPYSDNRGWRVLLMGVPAAGVAVGGIASHYQQAMKHNRLAEVSNLLYDQARAGLEAQGQSLPGRKIKGDDWDGAGLIPSPITEVCGVPLPQAGADPGQVRLKYVRTTTVKKILSSYICVEELERPGADGGVAGTLAALEQAAAGLA
jgi:5-methylcytosine-specific restriction enzyme B